MKLTLLLCVLLLSAQAWCASGMAATTAPDAAVPAARNTMANYSAIGENPFPHRLKKPLREKALYYRGKGTMGLILGLTMGPIGWGAVRLFSHNQAQREKARTGMIVWIGVVMVGGVVWGAIASKISLDEFIIDFLQAMAQT
jgi:hypothetical protein